MLSIGPPLSAADSVGATHMAQLPERAHVLGTDVPLQWAHAARPADGVVCAWGSAWVVLPEAAAVRAAIRIFGLATPLLQTVACAMWVSALAEAVGADARTIATPIAPAALPSVSWFRTETFAIGLHEVAPWPVGRRLSNVGLACAYRMAAASFSLVDLSALSTGDVLVAGPHEWLLMTPLGDFRCDQATSRVISRYEPTMSQAPVGLSVAIVVGRANLSLGDIAALGPGAIVPISAEMPIRAVEIVVGDQVVGTGELVPVGNEVAVRLTQWTLSERP